RVLALERGVDHDRDRLLAHLGERLLSAVGGDHAEVLAAEGDLENLAHRGAVVDGQKGLGHERSPPAGARDLSTIVRTGDAQCQASAKGSRQPWPPDDSRYPPTSR